MDNNYTHNDYLIDLFLATLTVIGIVALWICMNMAVIYI